MREDFVSTRKDNAQKPISLELVPSKTIQTKQQLFLGLILNQLSYLQLEKDQLQQVSKQTLQFLYIYWTIFNNKPLLTKDKF